MQNERDCMEVIHTSGLGVHFMVDLFVSAFNSSYCIVFNNGSLVNDSLGMMCKGVILV